MGLDAILFDLDGTLIDSLPGIEFAVDWALASVGLPARNGSLRNRIGPPIRTIFSQILQDATELQLTALEQAFRQCYDQEGWLRTEVHRNAISTLRTLRQAGLRLFVVTNKPSIPTQRILKHLEIDCLFEALLSRNSRTPAYLSKGEMLRDICSRHHLVPSECLYVGDTLEDYHAASESGMPVALVPHGYGSLDLTNLPESCRALGDLADLLETVESLETL